MLYVEEIAGFGGSAKQVGWKARLKSQPCPPKYIKVAQNPKYIKVAQKQRCLKSKMNLGHVRKTITDLQLEGCLVGITVAELRTPRVAQRLLKSASPSSVSSYSQSSFYHFYFYPFFLFFYSHEILWDISADSNEM